MEMGKTEGNILSWNQWFPPVYAVHWLLLSETGMKKTLSDESKSVQGGYEVIRTGSSGLHPCGQ